MKNDKLSNEIIYLPRQFWTLGNISMYSLLEKSGYFEMYDQVSESDLIEELSKHPECINDWIQLSEDKRTSSGWYFIENDDKYIVGYYPETAGFKSTEYTDIKEACAVFIKREIEDMRRI